MCTCICTKDQQNNSTSPVDYLFPPRPDELFIREKSGLSVDPTIH